jgi:fructose-1,6-bisphosphatase/inositol monophosphatase family enzyme
LIVAAAPRALPALPVDAAAVSDIVSAAAAAAVLPRWKALASGDVRSKSRPDDLVTAADIDCQEILTERLAALLPGAVVVGEEGGGSAAEACAAIAAAEWCWIIDPLDGTHNFVHSRSHFVVMVALAHRGETVGGWIHSPLAGETHHALAGGGAWRGAARLMMAASAPLGQMTGVLYVGAKRAPALHARLKQIERELGPVSFLRSAGSEYLGLAEGRVHYAIFTLLFPWDHAAGMLLVSEAGGHVAYWDGEPYRPSAARPVPVLLAPDAETWRNLRDYLGPAP